MNRIDKKVLKEYNALRGRKARKRLCHAPFRALRFSQSGNMLACCYNRGYFLGRYPQQSIREVWFGDRITGLRDSIKDNDLSCGCQECARRFDKRLFGLAGMNQYDYLSDYRDSLFPGMLDFEISNICNLECRMCLGENSSAIRANREKLPPVTQRYDRQFVEQLKEFIPHLHEARFSGGEPFLIPIYYDIWEQIILLNPSAKISVLTNASILNDRIKDLLSKGNFCISVSIDSLNKETYEKVRYGADFTKVISNLEYFYNYSLKKHTTFSLNACLLPYNWSEIPSIVDYCNSKNIELVIHTVVFPPKESLWAMTSQSLKEIGQYLSGYETEKQNMVTKKNDLVFRQLINQVRNWSQNAEIREQKTKSMTAYSEKDLHDRLIEHLGPEEIDIIANIYTLLKDSGLAEENRRRILINLLNFSRDLIISEIKTNEPDKLLVRLKMFNY